MKDLVEGTGITAVTLRQVLRGQADPKFSTIVAISEQLGLELVLAPREVAQSIGTTGRQSPGVQSLVERVLSSAPKRLASSTPSKNIDSQKRRGSK